MSLERRVINFVFLFHLYATRYFLFINFYFLVTFLLLPLVWTYWPSFYSYLFIHFLPVVVDLITSFSFFLLLFIFFSYFPVIAASFCYVVFPIFSHGFHISFSFCITAALFSFIVSCIIFHFFLVFSDVLP